ncbi:MAG TPA: dethiobiotin synthase [Candidatus Acidoferrales bacterium]|nr:dethiobiotin synthase [Candidatus Acidoferrales bacterium]
MTAEGFFVTGTDTGVGKTVLAALLVAALDAVYWKPIQTGLGEGSDRETVMRLASIPASQTRDEIYRFDPPVSPHLAARRAGGRIDLARICRPRLPAGTPLVAEGAGGALVPINECEFMTDVMRRVGLPVLVAARSTLGTINHTLLTLAALDAARLPVAGVVLVGPENKDNREAIERYGRTPVVGAIPPLAEIRRETLIGLYRAGFDSGIFR